jgi:hypothetical protein
MKIIMRVGERLLPHWIRDQVRPVLTFTGAGRALADGSRVLVRRGWTAVCGRLDGWERYAAVAFAGYVVVYAGIHARQAAPFVLPVVVVVWCSAAWCVAPPAATKKAPAAEASAPANSFAVWLLEQMGDQPGIHLRDLYPAMRQLPGHEGRDNAQLRAALRTLGIPVQRSLRIGHIAGRSGVARADVEALLPLHGEPRVAADGDAGQSTDSPAGESSVERVESA